MKTTTVTTRETRIHLGELIERVRDGERVLISRHGRIVAELVKAKEKR